MDGGCRACSLRALTGHSDDAARLEVRAPWIYRAWVGLTARVPAAPAPFSLRSRNAILASVILIAGRAWQREP
jgi:hypothetical protein